MVCGLPKTRSHLPIDYKPLVVPEMIKPETEAPDADTAADHPLEHINFFKHLEDGKVLFNFVNCY